MKILVAYDGSPDAKAAVTRAGSLFDGNTAMVLTVWEGLSETATRAGAGLALASLDFEAIDDAAEQAAWHCAKEGTGHARVAGLAAAALTARRQGTVAETILDRALEVDANVICLGSRGLSGVKSVLLGSVSRAVLQHADRPVLVVPTHEAAAKRSRQRHRHPTARDQDLFSVRL